MFQKSTLEAQKLQLEEALEIAKEKSERLEVQFQQLKQENGVLRSEYDLVEKEFQQIKSDYQRIKELYENLLSNSGQLNQDLAQQQQRLMAIEDDLEVERKKNEALAEDLEVRERRVAELERIIADKEKAVQALKDKITEALLNFHENDLSVEVKNGKVYVSLAEQLLFGSGSIEVDSKGVNALTQLAGALKGNPDIHIMVEGHTDDVPISKKSRYMNDNWDLSVMRATSIVKTLVNNGVDPKTITASGKGEFSPVVANNSATNKAPEQKD